MEMFFPIFLELDHRFPAAADRIWGHLSERLLGAFIVEKAQQNPLFRAMNWQFMLFPGQFVR
jgi:hypothetical protein